MALKAKAQWKEVTFVTDEEGRTFTFDGGWGVTPPVVAVPPEADWSRCVPEWLAGRRAEVIKVLEGTGQVVVTGRYPYLDGQ
jgi:hypothetical protein